MLTFRFVVILLSMVVPNIFLKHGCFPTVKYILNMYIK